MSGKRASGFCNVKIKDLCVNIRDENLLDRINIELNCGELTAIIGTNGAGKTTLLRSILGEIKHEGHVMHVDKEGNSIENIRIGYIPQYLDFDRGSPFSVLDFLTAGRTNLPVCFLNKKRLKTEIMETLKSLGCEKLIDRTLGELSGGELQRIMLAHALFPNPELLILDEPVSGVDFAGAELFYKNISELKKTYHIAIAMVSHDLSLVKHYADKVVLINKQVLKQGSVEDVFSSKEFNNTFFGGIEA